MAITHQEPLKEAVVKYHSKVRFITMSAILLSIAACTAYFYFYKGYDILSPDLLVPVSAFAFMMSVITCAMYYSLTLPVKQVRAAALLHSEEQSDTTPPGLNDKSTQMTGVRPLLEIVYSSEKHTQTTMPKNNHLAQHIQKALSRTTIGIITLNSDNEVIYKNTAGPVSIDNDGIERLDIVKEDIEQIHTWLKKCRNGAIRDSILWKRLATKDSGKDGRRVFDIYADYERSDETDTILICIDRTRTYDAEDEQLDFIAFAAHELRSPITVIKGYLDTLRHESIDDPNINNEYTQLLGRIIISANRLSTSINNILNAARYDRQHLKLNLKEQHIDTIFEYCHEDLLMHAQAKDRNLITSIPKNLPTIAADRTTLLEVFTNLVENAIKYTNDGGTISVIAKQAGDFIQVDVTDDGIGIPSNLLSNLFSKFYRSHRSRDSVSGTGIGLHICKMVVESHGGTIVAQSVEGKGSTFTFTLPIYSTVAKKLSERDNSNEVLLQNHENKQQIINHTKYKG